jgi:hypothetical protein
MPPIRSNFRELAEHRDNILILVTQRPGVTNPASTQTDTPLTAAGVQDFVNEACERGFHPSLVVWATGWMNDYYEQAADEDDELGESWAALTPMERREFVKEQAEDLARNLSSVIEFHQYEPIPYSEDLTAEEEQITRAELGGE